jgi:integrase/recombinase XerC/integrase/recombinase XerD
MENNALTVTAPTAITGSPDVLGLMADWHAHLDLTVADGERSDLTAAAYRRGLDKFLTWCESDLARTLDKATGGHLVTADTLRHWMGDLRTAGRKPNTVNAWLAGVRAFFAWGTDAHRLAFNPTTGLKGARRKGTGTRHLRDMLSNGEVRRVLALPDPTTPAGARDGAILALMAYTAARTIEVHRADLADLHTEGDKLTLRVQGKGRTEKDELLVIANPEAEAALHTWCAVRGKTPGALFTSLSRRSKGGRLSLPAIRHLVKAYYRAAGVVGDGKTTHSLRHSAISNAVKHGAPVQKVRAMARHASLDTTMVYYHETDRIANPAEGFIDYSGK